MSCQWKDAGLNLTPTLTLTLTLLLVLCGSGLISNNNSYYYYDCSRIYRTGINDLNSVICFDRNSLHTNNVLYTGTSCNNDYYTNIVFIEGCNNLNLINFITNC